MSSIQNKMLHFLLQKKLQICLEWNQFCLASSETDKCPLYIKKKKKNQQTNNNNNFLGE